MTVFFKISKKLTLKKITQLNLLIIKKIISNIIKANVSVKLPNDINFKVLSTELTVPKNLTELANQNQLGLVMLKIVEIIGEDNISDLDPETVYFLNKILNELDLKKIRNTILSEALPLRA